MLVLSIPTMQLQDELPSVHEALIFIAAMSAGAAEQLLIPSADRRNIVNTDGGANCMWTTPCPPNVVVADRDPAPYQPEHGGSLTG